MTSSKKKRILLITQLELLPGLLESLFIPLGSGNKDIMQLRLNDLTVVVVSILHMMWIA